MMAKRVGCVASECCDGNRVRLRAIRDSECCDSKRGRLKSTRAVCGYRCIIMATVNVTITQQITFIQLSGHYYMYLRS